jgi:hypothetical protein
VLREVRKERADFMTGHASSRRAARQRKTP